MISSKIINDRVRVVSENNTALDMLLRFEETLDTLGLYAYENWLDGELLEGPTFQRHFVAIKLIYDYNKMPDPEGAKRLLQRDCMVKFEKDTLITKVKVNSPDDVMMDIRPDGNIVYKAKKISSPVWVVEIKIPRRLVDEFMTDLVSVDDDDFIDTENLNTMTPHDQQQAEEEPEPNEPESGIGGLL